MLSTPYAWACHITAPSNLPSPFIVLDMRSSEPVVKMWSLFRLPAQPVYMIRATCAPHQPCKMWLNMSPSKTSGPMDLLRRALCCLCDKVLYSRGGDCGGAIGHEAKRLRLHTALFITFLSFTTGACSTKWV
jgi:hypothetical protein